MTARSLAGRTVESATSRHLLHTRGRSSRRGAQRHSLARHLPPMIRHPSALLYAQPNPVDDTDSRSRGTSSRRAAPHTQERDHRLGRLSCRSAPASVCFGTAGPNRRLHLLDHLVPRRQPSAVLPERDELGPPHQTSPASSGQRCDGSRRQPGDSRSPPNPARTTTTQDHLIVFRIPSTEAILAVPQVAGRPRLPDLHRRRSPSQAERRRSLTRILTALQLFAPTCAET
jgi:hypothetical protein